MLSAPTAFEVPDSTGATIGLLRELRRGHARKQAANVAYWLYLGGLTVLVYGGWLVATVVHALSHPLPRLAGSAALQRAEPAGLCAVGLVLLAAVLWDAGWRGPVTVSQPTADWLLDTPVRRSRLLRPRYRSALLIRLLAGAVAGLVPTTVLAATGLSGGGVSHSLRLAGVLMLSGALLAWLGTGVAALAEAHPGGRWLRVTTLAAILAAAALAGLAALQAAVHLPAVIGTALLWSGPWGWAAQGAVALSGGGARWWPVAAALLAGLAVVAILAGDRAAPAVPAGVLRARARTMGSMSAAAANLDVRRVGTAYRTAAGGYGRVRFMLRPPLRRELVLPWRDLVALLRAPARLAWAVVFALAAAGLAALAGHDPQAALLPLAGALGLGYLAAANLCEGARLDADDTRRSGQLPFRYDELVWWHAIVPGLVLAIFGGVPAAVLAVAAGKALLLPLLAAAVLVLVGGALVNSYRGPLEAESMSYGFETPVGNTGGILVVFWYVTGPLLAVAPLLLLGDRAVAATKPGPIAVFVILSLLLAAWLGRIANRRACRLRTS